MGPALLSRSPTLRGGPLATLRAYFGDAALPAVYMANAGVTLVTGVASQWDDARGSSGFAPSLVQATGSRRPLPSVGADGVSILTFDGVNDLMATSSTNALFDLNGAYSLVYIGNIQQQAAVAGYPVGIADSAAANRFMAFFHNTGATVVRFYCGPSAVPFIDSLESVSTTRRLFIGSKNAATSISVDVPNQARQTNAAATNNATGNNGLTVGTYFGSTSNTTKLDVAAVLCIGRQVTAADIVQLQTFAASLNYSPAS